MQRRGVLTTVAIGAVVGPLVASVAALADTSYNARINQGNVPATAAGYSQDCNSDEFGSKQSTQDGWLFVASPSNFTSFEADFGTTKVILGDGNNPSGTSFYFTKTNDHLALITPAGWELTDAYANLDGDKDFFTLSHTCAASQSTEQSSGSTDSGEQNDNNGCDQQANNAGDEHDNGACGEHGNNAGGDASEQQANSSDDEDNSGAAVADDDSSSTSGTSTTASEEGASGSESGGAVVSGQSPETAVPTRVLGEKVTRPSSAHAGNSAGGATVAGESTGRAAALPFTEFIAGHLLVMASLMLGTGLLLMLVTRRRRRA